MLQHCTVLIQSLIGLNTAQVRMNYDWLLLSQWYYCYCAYILRISRCSGCLWVVPTSTGIFLRCLKIYGESRTQQLLLVSQKKIGGNHAFPEIIKLQLRKKCHTLLYILALFRNIVAYLRKCVVTPNFLSGFQQPLLRFVFPAQS